MPDVRKEAEVGDLKYIAQVNVRADYDGFLVAMIRYRIDRTMSQVAEAHYWTPEGQWVSFNPGGTYPPIRIPSIHWPEWAYEFLSHAHERRPRKS